MTVDVSGVVAEAVVVSVAAVAVGILDHNHVHLCYL